MFTLLRVLPLTIIFLVPCSPIHAASELFANLVLADRPIAYYPLSETAGAIETLDASGFGHHGVLSATGIALGAVGIGGGDTGMIFDGSTGRITIQSSPLLNPDHVSLEALVRWDGSNGHFQRVVQKDRWEGGEQTQWGLMISPLGEVVVEFQAGGIGFDDCQLVSKSLLEAAGSHHLLTTFDGTTIRLYLDGQLDREVVPLCSGNIQPSDFPVALGNQAPRDRPFLGLIDEVAVYDRVLDPLTIAAHAEAALGVSVSVSGLEAPFRVSCRNLTTGQIVSGVVPARSWSCLDLGLMVEVGDRVKVSASGIRK